jgi:protein-S-isoprenylcysteine O-methyltransferase Ste14
MYLGLILTNLGGLLLYRTWTFLILSVGFLGLVLRAWREEQALQAAFGQDWTNYCRQTPAWLPHLHAHRNDPHSNVTPSMREKP